MSVGITLVEGKNAKDAPKPKKLSLGDLDNSIGVLIR